MPKLDDLEKAGVFLSEDGTLHISTEKECATCHTTKPISEFQTKLSHGKRAHGKRCKQCQLQLSRAYKTEWARKKRANACQDTEANPIPTSESAQPACDGQVPRKTRHGKAPQLGLSLLSQAKDFAYAWELMLGLGGFQEQWASVPDDQKQAVTDELKQLQKMTKQLIKKTEGTER